MIDAPTLRIAPDVKLGRDVKIYAFVNLYGCEIGDDSKIGAFVEIQKGVRIGQRVKISSHTFICEGVTLEDEVFIGHGVMFTNDRYPRATNADGSPQTESRLGCDTHVDQARRLDRQQRDNFVWRDDRRAGHYRRGQRCHSRRAARHHRGRRAGSPPANYFEQVRSHCDHPVCRFENTVP